MILKVFFKGKNEVKILLRPYSVSSFAENVFNGCVWGFTSLDIPLAVPLSEVEQIYWIKNKKELMK